MIVSTVTAAVVIGLFLYFIMAQEKKTLIMVQPSTKVTEQQTTLSPSPSSYESDWKIEKVNMYGFQLELPNDWTMTEINRRPEPQELAGQIRGHDCADYKIQNKAMSLDLIIFPTCGFADGGGSPIPEDAVIVTDLPNNEKIIRYRDVRTAAITYAKAGLAGIEDSQGYHEELFTSEIFSIGEGHANALIVRISFATKPETGHEDEYFTITDRIVKSLRLVK
jgi:hypothetical protein